MCGLYNPTYCLTEFTNRPQRAKREKRAAGHADQDHWDCDCKNGVAESFKDFITGLNAPAHLQYRAVRQIGREHFQSITVIDCMKITPFPVGRARFSALEIKTLPAKRIVQIQSLV